jgi:hypothetical protein
MNAPRDTKSPAMTPHSIRRWYLSAQLFTDLRYLDSSWLLTLSDAARQLRSTATSVCILNSHASDHQTSPESTDPGYPGATPSSLTTGSLLDYRIPSLPASGPD